MDHPGPDLVETLQRVIALPEAEREKAKAVLALLMEHGGKQIGGDDMAAAPALCAAGWSLVHESIRPATSVLEWLWDPPASLAATMGRQETFSTILRLSCPTQP